MARALLLLLLLALGTLGQSTNCTVIGAVFWPLNTPCGGAGTCDPINGTCECLPGTSGKNDLVFTEGQCLTNTSARLVLAAVSAICSLGMVLFAVFKLFVHRVFAQRTLVVWMLVLYTALLVFSLLAISGLYLINSIPMLVFYLFSQLAMLAVSTQEHLVMANSLYEHWEHDMTKQEGCKKVSKGIFYAVDSLYFCITIALLTASYIRGDPSSQYVYGSLHMIFLSVLLGFTCFFGIIHFGWLLAKLKGINPNMEFGLFDASHAILLNFARFTTAQCGMLLCACVCIFVPTWYGCAIYIMHLVSLCSDAYWLCSIKTAQDGHTTTSSFKISTTSSTGGRIFD